MKFKGRFVQKYDQKEIKYHADSEKFLGNGKFENAQQALDNQILNRANDAITKSYIFKFKYIQSDETIYTSQNLISMENQAKFLFLIKHQINKFKYLTDILQDASVSSVVVCYIHRRSNDVTLQMSYFILEKNNFRKNTTFLFYEKSYRIHV